MYTKNVYFTFEKMPFSDSRITYENHKVCV